MIDPSLRVRWQERCLPPRDRHAIARPSTPPPHLAIAEVEARRQLGQVARHPSATRRGAAALPSPPPRRRRAPCRRRRAAPGGWAARWRAASSSGRGTRTRRPWYEAALAALVQPVQRGAEDAWRGMMLVQWFAQKVCYTDVRLVRNYYSKIHCAVDCPARRDHTHTRCDTPDTQDTTRHGKQGCAWTAAPAHTTTTTTHATKRLSLSRRARELRFSRRAHQTSLVLLAFVLCSCLSSSLLLVLSLSCGEGRMRAHERNVGTLTSVPLPHVADG